MGFDGWWGIDIYPYREDGMRALTRAVKSIYKFREIARRLAETGLEELQKNNDAIAVMDLLIDEVLR